jgi:hypothetical protein
MKAGKISFGVIFALVAFGARTARASNISYFTYSSVTVNDGGNGGDPEFNGLSSSNSYTLGGISGSAFADLSTGQLGISDTGSVPAGYGTINAFSEAFMGDSISASGSTAGLSLGLDLSLAGSSTLSDPSQNLTFVGVYVLTPGSFNTSDFTAPSQELYAEGFVLGPGTLSSESYFSQFGLNYTASYANGPQTIPLNIPFSTLGSNFDVLISLETYEAGDSSTGPTWSVDYYDPLNVSLVAPAGVTLTSASGVLPGTTSAVPEPRYFALLAGSLFMLIGLRRFSTN